ncbi:AAA family ATPase [Rhodoferax sp.]|uniref:AAA family ATPase n=1 Tax=Rhodoferax sp. TaxID=50421 RepID=UPI002625FD76|nr:AAA family ATPase [Rhodoferax sp.]MDD5478743.1 AAA family ATPase [Rhodoferax sp.]
MPTTETPIDTPQKIADGTINQTQKLSFERWETIKNGVVDLLAKNFQLANIAKAAKTEKQTLDRWLNTYEADAIFMMDSPESIAARLEHYLSEVQARAQLRKKPDTPHVETGVTRYIIASINGARAMCIPRLIDAPPGVGKTEGMEQYLAAARKIEGFNCPVWKIRLDGLMLTNKAILSQIAREILGVGGYGERNENDLVRMIDDAVQGRSGVLLVDEAQYLGEAATRNGIAILNTLRRFTDKKLFAVVLFGNGEIYRTLRKGHTQLLSRMDTFRVQIFGINEAKQGRTALTPQDVKKVVNAWGISGPEVEDWFVRVARQPGALRNVDNDLNRAFEEHEERTLEVFKYIRSL